jgi:hypothetical protein
MIRTIRKTKLIIQMLALTIALATVTSAQVDTRAGLTAGLTVGLAAVQQKDVTEANKAAAKKAEPKAPLTDQQLKTIRALGAAMEKMELGWVPLLRNGRVWATAGTDEHSVMEWRLTTNGETEVAFYNVECPPEAAGMIGLAHLNKLVTYWPDGQQKSESNRSETFVWKYGQEITGKELTIACGEHRE